eukprot:TRINITY_DN39593_c0_g2_i3.p2 TRINITY_DN39593_c0_g2~~TRINITY_DN39593_c0_g2_i3.p2  ORF type:complete len:158 (+),score=39.20 TRINITY_DN39593_c0_g2_i3:198-671(+)
MCIRDRGCRSAKEQTQPPPHKRKQPVAGTYVLVIANVGMLEAGVQTGDRVVEINDQPCEEWSFARVEDELLNTQIAHTVGFQGPDTDFNWFKFTKGHRLGFRLHEGPPTPEQIQEAAQQLTKVQQPTTEEDEPAVKEEEEPVPQQRKSWKTSRRDFE